MDTESLRNWRESHQGRAYDQPMHTVHPKPGSAPPSLTVTASMSHRTGVTTSLPPNHKRSARLNSQTTVMWREIPAPGQVNAWAGYVQGMMGKLFTDGERLEVGHPQTEENRCWHRPRSKHQSWSLCLSPRPCVLLSLSPVPTVTSLLGLAFCILDSKQSLPKGAKPGTHPCAPRF